MKRVKFFADAFKGVIGGVCNCIDLVVVRIVVGFCGGDSDGGIERSEFVKPSPFDSFSDGKK